MTRPRFRFRALAAFVRLSLMEREFLQRLQLRRDLKIHSDASLQFWFQGDQLRGAIAATEFQHLQIVAAGQMPAYRAEIATLPGDRPELVRAAHNFHARADSLPGS